MSNLRDRLKRINNQKTGNKEKLTSSNEKLPESKEQLASSKRQLAIIKENCYLELVNNGWKFCGFNVLKRVVKIASTFKSIKEFPHALPILVPDLQGHEVPSIADFVFFDLETTGLSGGAGTVAFLAAFGRIISGKLHITQYLLLDYSGQNDFLENIITEFNNNKSFIVTYNGKSFDSQVLNSMCLVNRIKPPLYNHVDLIHPARRLWKRIINDCSQASIEKNILGINRKDDISGALAPEIWFEFLKTGNTERLKGICDHNICDISGLTGIFAMIISIAKDPLNEIFSYDIEKLALYWRKYLRKQNGNTNIEHLKTQGEEILKLAADKNCPRAVYFYAYEQLKKGNYTESLKYVNKGLKVFNQETDWHNKLLRRKERLDKIINN